jgi:probable HAF family extracellular repeat protein
MPSQRRSRVSLLKCLLPVAALAIACTDPAPTAPSLVLLSARGAGGGGGPTVKSTNPSSGPVSTTLSVQVNGSGYEPGSRAVWALNGDTTLSVTKVKTNSTTFVSSAALTASITIGSDASLDLYDVVVITPLGKKGIGIELFAVTPQFVDLGAGDGSMATAINENGQIVGYGGLGEPFLWENGVLTRFGSAGSYSASTADDINDLGTVAGTANSSGLPQKGFLWTQAGGMQLISQTLGGSSIEVRALNNSGDVAGTSSVAGDVASHATLWKNGSVIDLQLPNFPTGSSFAWGINDAGVVVGQYDAPSGGSESFRWSAETGMVLITPVGGEALRINSDGVVVGQWGSSSSTTHAYRWESGTRQDLGTLGGTFSGAMAINDAGTIVGRAETSGRRGSGQILPFIWKPLTGMKALSMPPGRTSGQAWAINQNEWVAGFASTSGGTQRATLWKLH